MKTEITLTITCGEKTCGECQYKAIFRTGIGEFHPKCELFDNHYGNWGEVDMRRSRKCVAAQRKAASRSLSSNPPKPKQEKKMKTNTEALKKEAIFKAARLINGVDLSLLFSICEGQKTIRTTKVLEHLERAHEGMKDCGVLMRKLSDALPFERNPLAERVKELEQIEAENARLREELNALKETQENVEATHRLTLREVQAELMRVQTKIDDMKDCILCDAEPVAWLDFHNRADPQLSVSFDATATVKSFDTDVVWKEPLYKARTK